MMETNKTLEECQAFLAETRVGIKSIPEEGRGPLVVSIWYNFQSAGEVCVWTGGRSRKAKLLQKAPWIRFCVQDPNPLYKYVSVEGSFTIQPVDLERYIHPMALR